MKSICTLFSILLLSSLAFAQVPQAFNYQAVARDANGDCISDQEIDIRISLRDSSSSGTVVYLERHDDIITNTQGLFSLSIGMGVPQGTLGFNTLDWSIGQRWLEVEIDTGSGFVLVGSQQLMSVPYSIQSQQALQLRSQIPQALLTTTGGSTLTATLVDQWISDLNDHSYALYSLSATTNWIVAYELCRKAKGYMVTITSGAENQFLLTNVLSLPEAQGLIPIGLTDALAENRFDWITGEIGFDQAAAAKKIYRNWITGEPNNGLGLEHYTEIRSTSVSSQRLWNDIQGDVDRYNSIIVEFDNGIVSP